VVKIPHNGFQKNRRVVEIAKNGIQDPSSNDLKEKQLKKVYNLAEKQAEDVIGDSSKVATLGFSVTDEQQEVKPDDKPLIKHNLFLLGKKDSQRDQMNQLALANMGTLKLMQKQGNSHIASASSLLLLES
jgi:hypothetical protein